MNLTSAGVAVTATAAAARSKVMVMVHTAIQQTLRRSLSTPTTPVTRSAWTHLCTTSTISPRATSQRHHTGHLLRRQATGRFAVERLGGTREFSLSSTAATAHANTGTTATEDTTTIESAGPTGTRGAWSAKDPIQLDAPFLDMVRQRLEEKDDTSAYFMHCKEDPVRQAGVFMVRTERNGSNSARLIFLRRKKKLLSPPSVSFPSLNLPRTGCEFYPSVSLSRSLSHSLTLFFSSCFLSSFLSLRSVVISLTLTPDHANSRSAYTRGYQAFYSPSEQRI